MSGGNVEGNRVAKATVDRFLDLYEAKTGNPWPLTRGRAARIIYETKQATGADMRRGYMIPEPVRVAIVNAMVRVKP